MSLDISFLPTADKEYVTKLWERTAKDVTLQDFWKWFFGFLRGYSPLEKPSEDWVQTTRDKLHNSLNLTRKIKITSQQEGKEDEERLVPLLSAHLRATLPTKYTVNVFDISLDGGGGDIMCCFVFPDQRIARVGLELKRWKTGVQTKHIDTFKEKVKTWSLQHCQINLAVLCTVGTITGCKGTTMFANDAKQNYLYISQIPECERVHVLTTFLATYVEQMAQTPPLVIEDKALMKGTALIKEVVEKNQVEIQYMRNRLLILEETNDTLKHALREQFQTIIEERSKKRKR